MLRRGFEKDLYRGVGPTTYEVFIWGKYLSSVLYEHLKGLEGEEVLLYTILYTEYNYFSRT